jgi:hypothetical protein
MPKILLMMLFSLIMSGCSMMLPGTMNGLDSSEHFSFEIEKSFGTGKMTAKNLKTGEEFTGSYTGRYSDLTSAQKQFIASGLTTYTSFIRPNHATAEGILIGNQGTNILIYLSITPGLRPTGTGTGVDGDGNTYWVQF